MKKILILTLLLAGCTTTRLVPEPMPFNPPAALMQPPHANVTILPPTPVAK